jgi:hypothetical protein
VESLASWHQVSNQKNVRQKVLWKKRPSCAFVSSKKKEVKDVILLKHSRFIKIRYVPLAGISLRTTESN